MDFCSEDVVLNVGRTAGDPLGRSLFGKDALWELWHHLTGDVDGVVGIRPVHMLSDGQRLVLLVDATAGNVQNQQFTRLIVTGTIGENGLWEELWVEFDDQPVEDPVS
jgi:hypothetical protein